MGFQGEVPKMSRFAGVSWFFHNVARYPSGKGEVCKTFMRRFDSDPRLQSFEALALNRQLLWLPFGCQLAANSPY